MVLRHCLHCFSCISSSANHLVLLFMFPFHTIHSQMNKHYGVNVHYGSKVLLSMHIQSTKQLLPLMTNFSHFLMGRYMSIHSVFSALCTAHGDHIAIAEMVEASQWLICLTPWFSWDCMTCSIEPLITSLSSLLIRYKPPILIHVALNT
jgi:hypothetical protein